MNLDSYFVLFSNCKPVKGRKRSTICDLQLGRYYFIPNALVDLLDEFKSEKILNVLEKNFHFGLTKDRIEEYLEFLVKNNLGIFSNYPENFPELELIIDEPNLIEDVILEWSEANFEKNEKIISLLQDTGCRSIEIRCFEIPDYLKLNDFLIKISLNTQIRNCELYIIFDSNSENKNIKLVNQNPIISKLIIFNSPNEKKKDQFNQIEHITTKIKDSNCCGNVGVNFNVSLRQYIESITKNPCLNKKFAINKEGKIKNCPSLDKEFGSLNDNLSTLIKIFNNDDFQELWNLTKSQIRVCKECEFRMICGDCRAYLNYKNAKPKKCTYNPNTLRHEL
jgi:SPASM domain peptide maturase of grasp-with-spasm system